MSVVGNLDAPTTGQIAGPHVRVAGWMVAPGPAGVVVLVDGTPAAIAQTGQARPDVAAAVSAAHGDQHAGWVATVLIGGRPGSGVTIDAIALEADGTATRLGSATVQVTAPDGESWPPEHRGHLDQPTEGAWLDDLGLRFAGWAPPVDGGVGRIEVLVDGTVIGLARPLDPRPDIGALVEHPYAGVTGFDFLLERHHLAGEVGAVSVRAIGWDGTAVALGSVSVRRAENTTPHPGGDTASGTDDFTRAIRRPAQPGRVVLIAHNLGIGGAQRWFGDLSSGLHRRGRHSVVALAAAGGPWQASLAAAGIPVHLVTAVPLTGAEAYEHGVAQMAAMIAALEPQALVVNTRGMFGAVDAGIRLGLPVTWAIHESTTLADYWSALPRHQIDRHVVGRLAGALDTADRIVCAADYSAGVHGLATSRRAVTVPYGIDLAAIDRLRDAISPSEARRKLHIPPGTTLVVWLATFGNRKLQTALVETARRLRSNHPSLLIALVGRTEDPGSAGYADAVEHYIERAGLGEAVRCVPATNDPWDWLVAADLLACPSDAETLPYAIIEAMAFGVPVVATSVAGIPDVVVNGQTGWLVPSRDIRALVDAISAALVDPPQRRLVAANARALVAARHALEPALDRLEAVIAL